MLVTKIEKKTNTKFKVYLDGQFAFVLYKGELFRYRIEEEKELSEEDYEDILQNIVIKRAKLRAMHLLTDMDRTEEGLRTKLKNDGYTEEVIDLALGYVKSFGYVNDSEYARRFVESKRETKSRKEIYMLMLGKGLPSSLIDMTLEEYYSSDDTKEAIQKILRKKKYYSEDITELEKQKIYASLARKGFSYDDIRRATKDSDLDY